MTDQTPKRPLNPKYRDRRIYNTLVTQISSVLRGTGGTFEEQDRAAFFREMLDAIRSVELMFPDPIEGDGISETDRKALVMKSWQVARGLDQAIASLDEFLDLLRLHGYGEDTFFANVGADDMTEPILSAAKVVRDKVDEEYPPEKTKLTAVPPVEEPKP